jgi:putative holliday junction resolvase
MENKYREGRIIALDYGLARIGVALSDPSKMIASPLETMLAEKKTELTAAKVVKELKLHQEAYRYNLEEIVIGLPLLLNGKIGLQADEVKHFVEILRKLSSVPIVTWDERLTTVQADRSMREGNLTRKKRAKNVDSVSAVILLQNYLDHKSYKQKITTESGKEETES